MPIAEYAANSQLVSTTEWSLPFDAAYSAGTPKTDDGIYQLFLDLNALAAGDIFELKFYEKVGSASTQRLLDSCRFAGVQGKPNWVSPSLIFLHGWDITLKKIAGTDRTIDWSIRQVT